MCIFGVCKYVGGSGILFMFIWSNIFEDFLCMYMPSVCVWSCMLDKCMFILSVDEFEFSRLDVGSFMVHVGPSCL